MAQELTGKEVTAHLKKHIAETIEELKQQDIHPAFAIVRVGESPDDLAYEYTAFEKADELGIIVKPYTFPREVQQNILEEAIQEINNNDSLHGCLIFRPLPDSLDEEKVYTLLDPKKDIDGILPASLGSIFVGDTQSFAPCTAAACLAVLDYYNIPVEGRHVVVIGRSLVVGKPLAMMLLERNATVTICHSHTQDLATISKAADIVVCATGRPRGYGAEYFSSGQIVLDVGINFDEKGTLCGDVDYTEVAPLVKAITPVPRGIGSITTVVLLYNVVQAARKAQK